MASTKVHNNKPIHSTFCWLVEDFQKLTDEKNIAKNELFQFFYVLLKKENYVSCSWAENSIFTTLVVLPMISFFSKLKNNTKIHRPGIITYTKFYVSFNKLVIILMQLHTNNITRHCGYNITLFRIEIYLIFLFMDMRSFYLRKSKLDIL